MNALTSGWQWRGPGRAPGVVEDVLLRERRPVRDGVQQLCVVTAKKPLFAGIDPCNKYVDRNSDGNVVAVE